MSAAPPVRPEGLHSDLPDAPVWPGWIAATRACIGFYSRLPTGSGAASHGVPDFRLLPRALPFAALIIAAPSALLLAAMGAAGLASGPAAALAVAALVLTTGAFHEDGLADSADGLFGGQTPERRLEIMKDSRIGSYGACALGLSLLLRATLIAAILDDAGWAGAAAAVLLAAPWSRAEGVWLLAARPPARSTGAAAAVGRPSVATAALAFVLSAAIVLALAAAGGLPLWGAALGIGLSHAAARSLAGYAMRRIGGQTGDIAGAVQQVGETALYLGLALALGAAR